MKSFVGLFLGVGALGAKAHAAAVDSMTSLLIGGDAKKPVKLSFVCKPKINSNHVYSFTEEFWDVNSDKISFLMNDELLAQNKVRIKSCLTEDGTAAVLTKEYANLDVYQNFRVEWSAANANDSEIRELELLSYVDTKNHLF